MPETDKPAAPSRNEEASASRGIKRKLADEEEDDFSHDEVRLWEDGFKERYYESKFAVSPHDEAFRSKVACEYVRGLCWVLQYYYQVIKNVFDVITVFSSCHPAHLVMF